MNRLVSALLALAAAAGVLAGCAYNVSYTYKITVEVETPEGVMTGSSVILAGGSALKEWVPDPTGGNFNWGVRGEAVTVDLGQRGVLFALLRGRGVNYHDHANYVARDAYRRAGKLPKAVSGRRGEAEQAEKLAALRGTVELIPSEYPFMVRFRDIADPKTVEAVEPENLAASFGDGVHLKRVTVEIVDAPVTTGIEKRLAWLVGFEGSLAHPGRSGGVRTSNDLAATLGLHDFKRGTDR